MLVNRKGEEREEDSFTGHQHTPSPAGKQVFILSYHHHEPRVGDYHPSFIDGDGTPAF